MLVGDPPTFGCVEPLALMYKIASSTDPPPLPSDLSDSATALIKKCLKRDPYERPTAQELLEDLFLAVGECSSAVSKEIESLTTYPTKLVEEPTLRRSKSPRATKKKKKKKARDTSPAPIKAWGSQNSVNVKGGFSDALAIESFVASSGTIALVASHNDIAYIKSLQQQKNSGLISEFEAKTKRAAILGIEGGNMVPCGSG